MPKLFCFWFSAFITQYISAMCLVVVDCGRRCFGSRSCLAPICPTIAVSNIRQRSLSHAHASRCGYQPAHTQTHTMCFIP